MCRYGGKEVEEILKTIQDLSVKEKKTFEQMGLKLAEESGECCQAILSSQQASGCGYKGLGAEDVREECLDTVIVALSLFYKFGGTNEEIKEVATKKILKWKEKSNI